MQKKHSCQIKIGFFVLQDCPNFCVFPCNSCKKKICKPHSKTTEEQKHYCLECYQTNFQSAQEQKPDSPYNYGTDSEDLGVWYHHYRIYFYKTYKVKPFDEQDYQNFEFKTGPGLGLLLDDSFDGDHFFDS